LTALLLPGLAPPPAAAQAPDPPLQSRAERTNYEETSRYDDVTHFFAELQKRSPLVRVETFGRSQEGRALPLVVLADPPVARPADARTSGKPVVLVMANIHAGEVEGKEAAQHLARRAALGDLRPLLDKLVLLVAPVYNADGNEKLSVQNRTAQNGPVGGVGRRENAQGLDLNRDFMKLDAPETQALVGVFNRWDPHVVVDLHTTNGSHHGYHLTYSIPLNPTADPRLIAYLRGDMMPALTRAMLARHQFRTYYYGNFAGPAPRPGAPEGRSWRAFSHAPRVGQNYVGLRNRLAVLSEAYSYLDFRRRVAVTEAFVEEIGRHVAAHAEAVVRLTRQADADAVRRGLAGPPLQLGVAYEMTPLPEPVPILVGEVTKVRNPRSGRDMTAMVEDKATPVTMRDYGTFTATRSVAAARAYLVRPADGLGAVADKLRQHGVAVEELTEPLTAEVERFVVENLTRAERPVQGHREVRLKGRYRTETVTFPAGTILVRAAQPLGTLAAYLLEPESDDGLTTWNFLDAALEVGQAHPVARLTGEVKAAGRLLGPP
jgi:hypothetical protein